MKRILGILSGMALYGHITLSFAQVDKSKLDERLAARAT